ncbi:MAG: hypothetical protein H6Q76_1207 [Firmicutes bacterium]|nr:hypothetical protein [Bacillota bacterium]
MIKWVCYAVIGLLCFLILLAILAIPSLLLPPGTEFGSMSAAYGIAAVASYFCTPIIYRKIAGMIKR